MNIWRLVIREVSHRRLNFVLALFAVAVAVSCVVGAETLLEVDQLTTEQILAEKRDQVEQAVREKEKQVEKAGAELQDAMRKSMKGLGFNILILPEEQDLAELHLDGTVSKTMPEEYVEKLAASPIVTINHLLPSVTKRTRWEEKEMDIILQGTRGEVPIHHRGLKKPLLQAVAPGKMVVGHAIHKKLGLSLGDQVTFHEKEFTISTLHPERGTSDDVTIWIDLAQAQEILGMQNLISAILALECDCAGDRITVIRKEIQAILPGTQIIERFSTALARAEARGKAKIVAEESLVREQEAGRAALEQEEQGRAQLEQKHADFAGVLVPLVILVAAVWVGLLAFGNARQRGSEIGILRAIGLRSRQILTAFLTKAVLIGLIGGIFGSVAGVLFGLSLAGSESSDLWSQVTGSTTIQIVVCLSVLLAPLLSAIASWLPAMVVAGQDPATVLHGE